MGRRLGFLLITSMVGALMALMLARSAEPTRHSRERGNNENRRLETDILKLATLPSERRPAWTSEMRMAIEVKCDVTIPIDPVMRELPPNGPIGNRCKLRPVRP